MNTFKFNAFMSEFPFLAECLTKTSDDTPRDPKWCDGILVKRITADVLNETPNDYEWDGSLVGISKFQRVDFVLVGGVIIKDAVKRSGTSGSNYAHSATSHWEGETVLEAVARQGVADTLAFVVWTEGGYNIENHYSEPNWRTVVYKPAKDFTLAEAIAQAQAQALAEVQAEVNF